MIVTIGTIKAKVATDTTAYMEVLHQMKLQTVAMYEQVCAAQIAQLEECVAAAQQDTSARIRLYRKAMGRARRRGKRAT